jgi:hypothetical protein
MSATGADGPSLAGMKAFLQQSINPSTPPTQVRFSTAKLKGANGRASSRLTICNNTESGEVFPITIILGTAKTTFSCLGTTQVQEATPYTGMDHTAQAAGGCPQ